MLRYAIAILVSTLATSVLAGDCCKECGCGNCRKVCKLVCEMKKETVTCWDCKCEDFCIPGPSCLLGTKCVQNQCDPCRTHREFVWKPSCGPVRQRTVLVKVPKTIEKPSYKCVVETVCCKCGHCQVDSAMTQRLVENGQIEGIEFEQATKPLPPEAVTVDGLADTDAVEEPTSEIKQVGFLQRIFSAK